MRSADFIGSIPENYDQGLGPTYSRTTPKIWPIGLQSWNHSRFWSLLQVQVSSAENCGIVWTVVASWWSLI